MTKAKKKAEGKAVEKPDKLSPPKLNMQVSNEFLEMLDSYRRELPTIPSRSEAARKLITEGCQRARLSKS